MKNKTFFKINIIYFIAMILVALIFILGYLGFLQNEYISSFLIQIMVMFAIPLLMYTMFISKSFKQTFKDTGFKKISGRMIAIAIVLGIVLYFINNFVAQFFSSIISIFGYENIGQTTTVTFSYELLFREFLLSCVLPGFCEEFLHRGIMLHASKKCGNTRYVLISSSILFGLMHLNINQFFYAAILGFLMGYVSIVSDSIYPSIIIHFMNNFLNTYFYYGYYLNWPFATFINDLQALIMSNIFVFIIINTLLMFMLIALYIYLTRVIAKERVRYDVKKIISCLEINNLPIEEAQNKINQANQILQKSESLKFKNTVSSCTRFSFLSQVFIISSFILGGLITISTFIWGII